MMHTYLIADLGLNHNSNFNRARNLIFQAKQCGFDAVKFQLYDAEKLTSDSKTKELLRAGKFDPEWLSEIRSICDMLEIDLAVTPFYPEAIDLISPYVDWIKIGSAELNYFDLLNKAASSNLPLIISAGYITNPMRLPWIQNLRAVLYCIPEYPCAIDNIDMNWITVARKSQSAEVGWSDHSHNPNIIWAALIAGASHIELHFDSDGGGIEFPLGHVWSSDECMKLIKQIREAEKCFLPTSYVPDFSRMTGQTGRRK
jgi:sialic acid synthase SpsE